MVAQIKLIEQTKHGSNVPSFQVAEVDLVQCKLVDNQYQHKSKVLFTFTPNKSCVYLLNIEPSNFVFLKTINTEIDDIKIIITDQNGRPLEIEDKVNLKSFFNN